MNKLLTAQELIKTGNSAVRAGFNMRVFGYMISALNDCNPRGEYSAGFYKAGEMIEEGKIFYTHRFKCSCGGHAFPYGGFWVCNDCGGNRCKKDWWDIRVQKDGDAWCCVGLGFEDLQASDNYAFGDTRQGAIDEYEKLMRGKGR